MSHPEPLLDLFMRNALALVALGQAGVDLREEDQALDRVIYGRVGRQVLQGLKDTIPRRWSSHRAILPLTSMPDAPVPTWTPTASAEHRDKLRGPPVRKPCGPRQLHLVVMRPFSDAGSTPAHARTMSRYGATLS